MSFIFFFSFIIGTVLLVTRPKEDEASRWMVGTRYKAEKERKGARFGRPIGEVLAQIKRRNAEARG
jgi:hypothetical protein